MASVTTRTPTAPERLLLGRDGAVCVDLGGYLTHSGEMVRWRSVLRWSAPRPADVADVFALAESVGDSLTLVDVALLSPPDALTAVSHAVMPAVVYSTGSGAAGAARVHEVCALLLGVLGVGDDDIARDHALAGGDAPAMRGRLLDIRLGHGSMRGYAFDLGVDVAVVEQLRDRLLF